MILFDEQFRDKILRGIKTETWRTGKLRCHPGEIHAFKTDPHGKVFAWGKITRVELSFLGKATRADAMNCGFPDLLQFKRYWILQPGTCFKGTKAYQIKFEVQNEHAD